jgi:hypothetical protein
VITLRDRCDYASCMTSDTRTVHSFTGLLLNKVPEVTIYFWLIKVLSTTVGET